MRFTFLIFLSVMLLFSTSCVSKKKYLALETQLKDQQQTAQHYRLQMDSLSRVNLFLHDSIHDLDSLLIVARTVKPETKTVIAPKKSSMTTDDEYDKKAIFVYNFTKYVSWPALATVGSNFVIGVVGDSPLTDKLLMKTDGKKVLGKPIEVRRMKVGAVTDCQLIYVPHSQIGNLSSIKKSISKSTLIVTEENIGQYSYSHINLYPDDAKVRYSVNKTLMDKGELKATQDLIRFAN
jgi:hypothetical protein